MEITKQTREALEKRSAPFDLTPTQDNDAFSDYFINQFKGIELLISQLLSNKSGNIDHIKQEANDTARKNEKLVLRLNK